MCKHILNAQVSIRAPCCRKWFDCSECHAEQETHFLQQKFDLTLACKKCKKCFRKDVREFEECDEYCPHCDNHFLLEAKVPKATASAEKSAAPDVRVDSSMLKDHRVEGDRDRERQQARFFDDDDLLVDRLG